MLAEAAGPRIISFEFVKVCEIHFSIAIMGWLILMQKCGNVAIFWALLASVDLILRGKYVNYET